MLVSRMCSPGAHLRRPPPFPILSTCSFCPPAEEAKEAEEEAAPAAAEYDASFAAAQLPGAEEGYDAYG